MDDTWRDGPLRGGGENGRLGSVEFLSGAGEALLFGMSADLGDSVGLDGLGGDDEDIPIRIADRVAMNPTLAPSEGGSPLLGSLDANEFPVARAPLAKLATSVEAKARNSSRLGSLFVPLVADLMVKPGGRQALPKAVLTGALWDSTPNLVAQNYDLELVIVSYESGHGTFSDCTDLSGALLVAHKRHAGDRSSRPSTTGVQLSRNPGRALDALAVESALETVLVRSQGNEQTIGSTLFGAVGQVFSQRAPTDDRPWISGTPITKLCCGWPLAAERRPWAGMRGNSQSRGWPTSSAWNWRRRNWLARPIWTWSPDFSTWPPPAMCAMWWWAVGAS